MSRAHRTIARLALLGLTIAACRPTEPVAALERDAGGGQVASDAAALALAPIPAAPTDALVLVSDATATATATATAKCQTAVELQHAFIDETPTPLVPGLDLDGDGKNDPVFVVAQGGPMTVTLYVERAGCARHLGALHASDLKTVRIHGRDKAGWAIVHGSMPFTFDEIEEKLVYEAPRYVVWTRRRDYPLPPPGQKRTVTAWSPWTREEPGR